MNPDPNVPVLAEGSISVGTTLEQVWEVLADFERGPGWNPDVESVSIDGPVATGTKEAASADTASDERARRRASIPRSPP